MRKLFELLSERQRDLYMLKPRQSRQKPGRDYRNGYYERDFVTRFGTLRLRIARTRKRRFLPAVLQKFQRRAEEVNLLIREAFLRGISTRQVGRLVAILTGEPVSPQTVSRLTRTHSPSNEITMIMGYPVGSLTVASDNSGNILNDVTGLYSYDEENRLVQAAPVAGDNLLGRQRDRPDASPPPLGQVP